MKPSEKKINEDENSSVETIDPFARDFFNADDKIVSELDSKQLKVNKTPQLPLFEDNYNTDWAENLPKVSYKEFVDSSKVKELPNIVSDFSEEILKNIFSRYTKLDLNQIYCKILSTSEVNLLESAHQLTKSRQVYLKLLCNSQKDSSIIGINSEFASAIIDLVLGGEGKSEETLRSFSSVEKTIVEFLAINIFSEFNNASDESIFCLQEVSNDLNTDYDFEKRGVEIVLDLVLGDLEGNVSVLLPTEVFQDLQSSSTSLLETMPSKLKIEQIKSIFDRIEPKISLGNTKVNADELPFLERDDVVLVDTPNNVFGHQQDSQEFKVFIGEGTNYYLNGKASNENLVEENVLTEEFLFEINSITNQKNITIEPKRFEMSEKTKEQKKEIEQVTEEKTQEKEDNLEVSENEQVEEPIEVVEAEDSIDEDQSLASLENVLINLRVQMASKKFSLAEVQTLRAGQVIDLGCRPTDAVEIVTDSDNKPIASGELVDIEGQLGVRLTKIFI